MDRSRRAQQVALGSLLVGALICLGKLVVGILTGSLGLLSEAAHSGFDVVASGFALVAVRTARRPADEDHLYGHGRAENLAAYTEGLVLLVTAGGIAVEAVRRLLGHPATVNAAGYAIALLLAAMAVEAIRAVVLRAAGRAAGSDALAADAQNRVADVLASLGVVAGLVGVRYGFWWADSVAALVVAALIGVAAVRILWQSGDELMDRAPAGAEAGLRRAIGGVSGVREIRGIRVRRSGGRLLADARVSTRRTLSVEAAERLTERVQAAADRALPGMDLVLVVEGQLEQANLVERIHATANRLADFRDIHNVTVEQEDDGSLHLTLHAKLPSQLPLEEAEALSAELEDALRSEMPDASRVDIHLEPLEPDVVAGRDVTASRTELAERIRQIAVSQPEVLLCRDVELSSRDGRITAHVVVEMTPAVSLEQAHLVEDELERRILHEEPELENVVTRATVAGR